MGIVRNSECRQLRWGKLRWRRCESIGENDGLGREIENVGESIGEGDRGDWEDGWWGWGRYYIIYIREMGIGMEIGE